MAWRAVMWRAGRPTSIERFRKFGGMASAGEDGVFVDRSTDLHGDG